MFKNFFKVCFFVFSLILVSCSKKEVLEVQDLIEVKNKNHEWFCFYGGKIKQVENLSEVPFVQEKPYTEAVRISDISIEKPSENEVQKGFALVNQIGFLTFEDEKFTLSSDFNIFGGKTSDNLVFCENLPVCNLYKNSFFNDFSVNQNDSAFLVFMNPQTKVFYKILNTENISNDSSDQVTDFLYDGNVFSCMLKNSKDLQINFKYISFQLKESISLVTPQNTNENILISYNSQDEFRNAKKIEDFSKAPDRLKNLLKSVKNQNFEIKLYNAGGSSPKIFVQNKNDSKTLNAEAIFSETFSAVLFQDGTIYLNGFINNKSQINSGKTCGIKLPKLPKGFLYTGFALSDNTLYASWEQTNFVKTSKSGFLMVKLSNLLQEANLLLK